MLFPVPEVRQLSTADRLAVHGNSRLSGPAICESIIRAAEAPGQTGAVPIVGQSRLDAQSLVIPLHAEDPFIQAPQRPGRGAGGPGLVGASVILGVGGIAVCKDVGFRAGLRRRILLAVGHDLSECPQRVVAAAQLTVHQDLESAG